MLCSAQEEETVELYEHLRAGEWPRLFTAPVCVDICPLVRMSVSEISSAAPCGCVIAVTSQRLGGVVAMTTHLTPAPHHQCIVSKMVAPQGSGG